MPGPRRDLRAARELSCAAGLAGQIPIDIIAYPFTANGAYDIGVTLFDLPVFEQAFWTALHGEPCYSSLEGDLSHLGRRFSSCFNLLLPFHRVHRGPETLLVPRTYALGIRALPLQVIGCPSRHPT